MSPIDEPANIRVLVRVRPLNEREKKFSQNLALSIENNGTNIDFAEGTNSSDGAVFINEGGGSGYDSGNNGTGARVFRYDAVFGPNSNQLEIFDSIKGIVDAVCAGYNGTIVAYGQTGSGKTHTIFGEEGVQDNANAGLVQRSVKAIYHKIAESQLESSECSQSDGQAIRTTTKASFLEIYNERVYDLLSVNDDLEEALPVREDSLKGVYVEGLSERTVRNTMEAMEVLSCGINNRKVAATNMNRVSSRSHAMFVLTVRSEITSTDGVNRVRSSKFTLVDLAGSERQKNTDSAGDRLKEASMINNSLLCLGQVINSLVENQKGLRKHAPFRDSKLTFLLRDSFGGNSKTCLVATVTPSIYSLTETVSTLKFAQRAKMIKNNAVLNEDTCGSVVVLQAEITRLKRELQLLNHQSTITQDMMPSSGYQPLVPRQNIELQEVTVKALRNQNSKLNKTIDNFNETANMRESQINSLKRKLQQETMIRKFKERRITYLTGKSEPSSTLENEENTILREEIANLREQLDRQPLQSVEWMLKFKEEKAKVKKIQNDEFNSQQSNDRNELEGTLVRVLNERDSLQKKLDSNSSQRTLELNGILQDVTQLENQNVELQRELDNKIHQVSCNEQKLYDLKVQLEEFQHRLASTIADLTAEHVKSQSLQSLLEGKKNLEDKYAARIEEYKCNLLAAEGTLAQTKSSLSIKIVELETDLSVTKNENRSLVSTLQSTTDQMVEKDNDIQILKSNLKGTKSELEILKQEVDRKNHQIAELERSEESLVHDSTEYAKNLLSTDAERNAMLRKLESSTAHNRSLQNQLAEMSSLREEIVRLEDEVFLLNNERDDCEKIIEFSHHDSERTFRFHDWDLMRRDEIINTLKYDQTPAHDELSKLSRELIEVKTENRREIDILQNEILFMKEERESTTLDKKRLNLELDTTKEHYARSVTRIADLEKETSSKISSLEAERDNLAIEVNEMRSVLDRNQKSTHELLNAKEKVVQHESFISELVIDRCRLTDVVTALKAEIVSGESVKHELLDLKLERDRLKKENTTLKSKDSSTSEKVVSLKHNLAALENEFASLREESEDNSDPTAVASLLNMIKSPMRDKTDTQHVTFIADDSFDESMFLPNVRTDENQTPSKTPFKERRQLFSPEDKSPSIGFKNNNSMKNAARNPLGRSAAENDLSSRKIRTNFSGTYTSF